MMQEIWIIPTNPKYFDVESHLKTSSELVIKRTKMINKGDIAYIYVASPVSQIKYKGIVANSECGEEILSKHPYARAVQNNGPAKYFLVKIEKAFDDNTYNYSDLKEHGIGQVQNIARASRQIKEYFKQVENKGEIV